MKKKEINMKKKKYQPGGSIDILKLTNVPFLTLKALSDGISKAGKYISENSRKPSDAEKNLRKMFPNGNFTNALKKSKKK